MTTVPFTYDKISVKFRGKPARVDLKSHPEARRYRTRLKEGGAEGPNFADHMTIVIWGCGTECESLAFVDARNGRVYFDEKLRHIAFTNVHSDAMDRIISYRRDSTLLIVAGCPNEECSTRRGVNYFIWTGSGLKHILRIPRGWYPEKIR